jgi:hypothetical protein
MKSCGAILPVAPRPFPNEAPSSWLARVAARYDLSTDAFVLSLLGDPESGLEDASFAWFDHCSWPAAEAALEKAMRLPRLAIRRLRGLEGNQQPWPRVRLLPWCQAFVAARALESGEFHRRLEWSYGGYVLCPLHNILLGVHCPLAMEGLTRETTMAAFINGVRTAIALSKMNGAQKLSFQEPLVRGRHSFRDQ